MFEIEETPSQTAARCTHTSLTVKHGDQEDVCLGIAHLGTAFAAGSSVEGISE